MNLELQSRCRYTTYCVQSVLHFSPETDNARIKDQAIIFIFINNVKIH